jgi:glycosyltransferase involved in cell wall biosynthesis
MPNEKERITMELTILMPCLNEAETLEECINKANQFLAKANIVGEVLISDNGSTDGSTAIAQQLGARVVHINQRGYGAALIGGIEQAKGKYIIMGDADASYDFSNLMPFVDKLRQGYELIMGNRFQGEIKPGAMPFLNKYLGNPVLSFIGRLFFKIPLGDFHCGLRGFNKNSIQSLQLQTQGMEFASEMVVKSSLKELKMTEVPIVLSPDGRSRPPHLRKWRDGWRHLRFLLLSSPNWLFLYPGLMLAMSGLTMMLFVNYAPFSIGKIIFDLNTLLFSSSFIVIGLQCIFFSIYSNILRNLQLGLKQNKKLGLIIQNFTLEKGIIFGLILVACGIGGFIWSFQLWMETQFGPLIPENVMRITIPSATFLIIGTQIIFTSFFMNLLIDHSENLKHRISLDKFKA